MSCSGASLCNMLTAPAPFVADGHTEKRVRGALKANVERAVSKRTTVLLDSLNSIKGYRSGLACMTACSPSTSTQQHPRPVLEALSTHGH